MRKRIYAKALDRWMFKKTSAKTKKINVAPTLYRGGIRL